MRQISAWTEQVSKTSWRDSERTPISAIEESAGWMKPRDVHEVSRDEYPAGESIFLSRKTMLIFNATFDEIRDGSRQAPFRQIVQICDIHCSMFISIITVGTD